LRYNYTGPNTSSVISYLNHGRVTPVMYKNTKHMNRAGLIKLNSALLSTTTGLLTEEQSRKQKVGGIYLVIVRNYTRLFNQLSNFGPST